MLVSTLVLLHTVTKKGGEFGHLIFSKIIIFLNDGFRHMD